MTQAAAEKMSRIGLMWARASVALVVTPAAGPRIEVEAGSIFLVPTILANVALYFRLVDRVDDSAVACAAEQVVPLNATVGELLWVWRKFLTASGEARVMVPLAAIAKHLTSRDGELP